jgi:hypothetical protein
LKYSLTRLLSVVEKSRPLPANVIGFDFCIRDK